jgi:predicted TIM-barrel fold metal-dependent hydrolase
MGKWIEREKSRIADHEKQAQWLAQTREDIIDPDYEIIDPHHHVWDHRSRYLLEELLDDLDSGHNITASVFIECNAMHRADGPEEWRPLGETEFINGVAAASAHGIYGPIRACAGIVGHVDLRIGARAQDILEAHIRAAGQRFKGVRNITAFSTDDTIRQHLRRKVGEHGLLDPKFREGFARLAPLGLTFDSWQYFYQIGDVADLARAFPGTTIVLDHVGGILGIGPYAGKRDEVFAQWKASIAEIGRCDNVMIKLGGLAMTSVGFDYHERHAPPGSSELAEAWRPYIETCIEAAGVSRCMFESNFPVDKASCSYPVLWNAFKRLAAGFSATEKAALFRETAARVYRL